VFARVISTQVGRGAVDARARPPCAALIMTRETGMLLEYLKTCYLGIAGPLAIADGS
jgi:hypothetical protein